MILIVCRQRVNASIAAGSHVEIEIQKTPVVMRFLSIIAPPAPSESESDRSASPPLPVRRNSLDMKDHSSKYKSVPSQNIHFQHNLHIFPMYSDFDV